MKREELRETVAREIANSSSAYYAQRWDNALAAADAAIAIVLEEAAKEADRFGREGNDDTFELAAAIRALKD